VVSHSTLVENQEEIDHLGALEVDGRAVTIIEIWWCVYRIQMAESGVQWKALVNAVVNFRVP
jgi:hypothetical protein